ncbi:hypothetical protein QCA50_000925 [Cerrena zonata]|uniref:Uncharacterized protein n=1 Tax=Cerrena zonata TaxID=2478898 RepID=A0AAW0GVQ2_9APHY
MKFTTVLFSVVFIAGTVAAAPLEETARDVQGLERKADTVEDIFTPAVWHKRRDPDSLENAGEWFKVKREDDVEDFFRPSIWAKREDEVEDLFRPPVWAKREVEVDAKRGLMSGANVGMTRRDTEKV